MEIVEQTLKESCNESEVLKCIHVGLLCVQEKAIDRPAMSSVFLMLSNENVGLPIPKQPAFVSLPISFGIQVSSSNEPNNKSKTVCSEDR